MRRQIWYFIDHICRHLSKLCYLFLMKLIFHQDLSVITIPILQQERLGTTDQRYFAFEDDYFGRMQHSREEVVVYGQ